MICIKISLLLLVHQAENLLTHRHVSIVCILAHQQIVNLHSYSVFCVVVIIVVVAVVLILPCFCIIAIGICFSMTDVFRYEVLAVVMQQIVDEPVLPVLFLRTVSLIISTSPIIIKKQINF